MIKATIHVPVVIPTLNRYTHFVRCLESIERCTGAKDTEVFVGLDYPPSEKYVEGWKKIDAYLSEKEKNNGFKHLHVRRRDHNCGLYGENSNWSLLEKEISVFTDRYIGTEDDNEFSPNFLEYMNKALDKYADDPRVITVSAYTPQLFSNLVDTTTFMGKDASAYGLGIWINKRASVTKDNMGPLLRGMKIKELIRLFRISPALLAMASGMAAAGLEWGDVINSMNNLVFNTFTLQPATSLSRTWGADGSGARSGIERGLETEPIQTDEHFLLTDIPMECPKQVRDRLRYLNMPKNKIKFFYKSIRRFIRVMRFYLFGK